jgi:peptidoglycan/xylan/chitin deacetylase (PgdA/CDA1 family)
MVPALAAVILLIFLPAIVYLLWRYRYGLPPPSFPRVLAYHKVTGFEFGGTWITPKGFISQVDFLIGRGYRFINEEQFLETLDGVRAGDAREILLTFDDGYRELLDVALPALEERSVPALIFLVSSYVGRENEWELGLPGRRFEHLSWDEIEDLAARGFSFGSHTCNHKDLVRITPDEVRLEMRASKAEIEERLGCDVRSISYPFGRTNRIIAREAQAAGYRAAFSLYPKGPNDPIDRYVLRREGVYIIDTRHDLEVKLGRGPFFWMEDMKGRAINAVAVLTPLLKRY